jgi:hypothetical protein
MKNLYFFNFKAHNGDLHYNREFVKDIINKIDCDEYYLLQNMSEKLLLDIDKLKFGQLNNNCFINETTYIINNDIYINIHPGRNIIERMIISQNEHNEIYGGALSLDYYYQIFSIIYNKLNIKISGIYQYIPDINYSKFEISNINNYIENNHKHKILICNGDCHNTHSSNDIDFLYITEKLSEKYTSIDFILTKKIDIEKENIIFTDDLIKADFPDLNEISYLSKFCDIIIGKASGPYCFTITKENIKNKNKSYIFITKEYFGGWLDGIYTHYNMCDKIWINNFDNELILSQIDIEIDRKMNYLNSKNYIENISINRNNNRFDFSSIENATKISIGTSIDDGNGIFDNAYGTYFDSLAKNCGYYIMLNRSLSKNAKIRIRIYYLQELFYEKIF